MLAVAAVALKRTLKPTPTPMILIMFMIMFMFMFMFKFVVELVGAIHNVARNGHGRTS
jgi:hypothetical protein